MMAAKEVTATSPEDWDSWGCWGDAEELSSFLAGSSLLLVSWVEEKRFPAGQTFSTYHEY